MLSHFQILAVSLLGLLLFKGCEALPQKFGVLVGHSQYHLAVAGGCAARALDSTIAAHAPTRYREVVLTVPKYVAGERR